MNARPIAAWAGMLAALTLCLLVPHIAPSGWVFAATLATSASMLLLLAFGLAGVGSLSGLDRLAAGAAFLFLALLLMLSFTDLATRFSGGLMRSSDISGVSGHDDALPR